MTDTSLKARLAPTGKLRACINLGNPVLAKAGADDGPPTGISVDLAQALAHRLQVPLELIVVDLASKAVHAVAVEQADVGFFAIDPQRGAEITFTAPYLLIEGCYLVRAASPLTSNEEVDRVGTTVVVGKGSAYDLHLSRSIAQASLVRSSSSRDVVDTFLTQGLHVAAGVKQQLHADAQRVGGLRLLPGRFMVIRQAMGLPKSRGEDAAAFLAQFVEDAKADGLVAEAMQRHGIDGASIARAGNAD